MLWLATLASELLFGFQVARWVLPDKYNARYWVGFAAPIGFGLSSVIYFICAALLGVTSFHAIVHTCGISAFSYILIGYMHAKKRETKKMTEKEWKDFWIFLGISCALSLVVVPKMYIPKPRHCNVAFSEDIREEIAMIQSFYRGVNSGLVNVYKIRHTACYRCIVRSGWLTAFHSAIMRSGYASLRCSMVWPSMVMFASVCYLFLNLARHFLESVVLCVLSMVLFLCAGGFGFCHWLEKAPRGNMSLDFVFNYGTGTTQWSHPLFHYIFGFRCSQLGLCVVLSAFLVLTKLKRESNGRELVFLGMLFGILPGVDPALCVMSFVYLGLFFASSRILPTRIPVLFVTFVIVSGVLLIQYVPRETYKPQIPAGGFYAGLQKNGVYFPAMTCWFDALGFLPLLALVVCWFFIDHEMVRFYLPSVVIFLIANSHVFYPYYRHNIKVFYPLWMTFAAIVTMQTMSVASEKPKAEEAKGVVIGFFALIWLCSIWSSVLGYYRLRRNSAEMWTEEDERVADWIVDNTPKKAVFVDCGYDYSPVSALAGKVLYAQSEKIAWINGYNTSGRADEIRKLVSAVSPRIAPKVKYLVRSRKCKQETSPGTANGWMHAFDHGNYTIYERR